MITVKVKEDRTPIDYDYVVSSMEELDERMKSIYKPIIGVYNIGLTLTSLVDIKFILNNKGRYNHLNLDILLSSGTYRKLSLAMPDLVADEKRSFWDYMQEGISKRNLLIDRKTVSIMYSSIGKSYEEIDDILDVLYKEFGAFMKIDSKDLSKHLVLTNIVYPRTVLISYINLHRWRDSQLKRCLDDISPEIVVASMVKTTKKLHEQKIKYLNSGIGTKFIRTLNTKNLNLMYRTLVTNKPYHLNDITILLEIYERGINIDEEMLGISIDI